MKPFLSQLLMVTLLCINASQAVSRETNPLGCWIDTSIDTMQDYSHIKATNFYCPVETSPGSNHFNIGKIAPYESFQIPECWHTSTAGISELLYYKVRFLNTTYDNLKKIIKSKNNPRGVMHEPIAQFNNRFPGCTGGYSPANKKPKKRPASDSAPVTPEGSELCLKEELDKVTGDRVIRIGYWTAAADENGNQCQITENSPSYSYYADQPSNNLGTPDRHFVCAGFEVIGSGWAGKKILGLMDRDYDCNKHSNKEDCCRFAQQVSDCKYLSWDPKGKCCCGPDKDRKDKGRGDENILLKRKR